MIMIKNNDVYYWFESKKSGRRYELYEMTNMMCHTSSIGITSDIICIWDDEENTIVNWVYGASDIANGDFCDVEKLVAEFVDDYELRHHIIFLNWADEKEWEIECKRRNGETLTYDDYEALAYIAECRAEDEADYNYLSNYGCF